MISKKWLLLVAVNNLVILGLAWGGIVLAQTSAPGDSQPMSVLPQGSGDNPTSGMLGSDENVARQLQYQGKLTDPNTGLPIADGLYSIRFRLYESAVGTTALWEETKNVQVTNGIFSTALGDSIALGTSTFNGRSLWLGVKIGSDAESSPRQQIMPVAYAMSLVPGAVISTTTGTGLSSTTSSTTIGASGLYGKAGTGSGFTPNQESGVWGDSRDGFGVAGLSKNQYGVLGYSESLNGVRGESFYYSGVSGISVTEYGGYFDGGDDKAIYANGSITATGTINGQYTSLPLAYGFINSDGTKASGSSNVTSTWNSTNNRYEITISGESYYFNTYVTQITPHYTCSYENSARPTSVTNKLIVVIYNSGGTPVQCPFQFVTYKP